MKKTPAVLTFLLVAVLLIAGCATPAETVVPTSTQSIESVIETYTLKTVEALDDRVTSLEKTVESLAITDTPTAEPTVSTTGTPVAAGGGTNPGDCLRAEFVADITIPDETIIPPGSPFKKTWAIKNSGSCPWDATYKLSYVMGDLMGAEQSVPLPDEFVQPGEMVLVSVNMVAPEVEDRYENYWKIQNSWGTRFGVEPDDDPLTLVINVAPSYSFVDNLCSATWHNAESLLFCPGKENNPDGSFYVTNSFQTELGKVETQPAILMAPQQVTDGQIYAKYAPVKIPGGAHLETRIGCIYGYEFCNFDFVVTYTVEGGTETILAEVNDWNDGFSPEIGVNLGDLGLDGKTVSFTFYVKANGGPEDLVFMENPRLKVH